MVAVLYLSFAVLFVLSLAALPGTNEEGAISEFLDKLVDGSSPFSVPSGDLEAFEAALSGSSGEEAKHEEL